MRMLKTESLKFDKNGLIPCIVQDASDQKVLMLGYMSAETLELTIKTGLVSFYSRSRNEIWVKGETSGNTLKLVSLAMDCDADALLVTARANGPTCHTGAQSCFEEVE